MPVDIVIRNARILDGTGIPAFEGDITIEGGRIASVGTASGAARQEIDANGLCLAPGFIDVHSHDDGAFLRYPDMHFKLSQGVTTCVCGNCGFSAIPARPGEDPGRSSGGIIGGAAGDFSDLEGYFDAVLAKRPSINAIMLVGHNTVRAQVMGMEQRTPTKAELDQMRSHVARAMDQGACGFSTGLIYRPGRWSDTEEVIELAREAAPYGALYTTHMRNEGDRLIEAVEETLTIAREAGVHAHISHHKSAGKRNWGKVADSLQLVDRARETGQKVTLDVYPYTAGSGRMVEYFRLDRIDRDYAEVIRIANCPAFPAFEGRMLKDIAEERGEDIAETVRLILTAPKGERTICIHFIIDEADIATNLRHPGMMVGSDGIPTLNGKPHPRLFGTFPRLLGQYVRDQGVLTLEDAVARITSISAETFGLKDRGRIEPGYHADIVLFDPDTIADKATYDDPKQISAGVSVVIVNGVVAWRDDRYCGAGSGQMLRYRRESYTNERLA